MGIRGKGFRAGFLNLPGGFTEEHTDEELVAAAIANPELRLGFDNEVDGESFDDAAIAELEEETGYIGPKLKAEIYRDAFATSMHERLVFVIMVVADTRQSHTDPSAWFSEAAIKTPGELTDGRWVPLDELPPKEEWAFPIFYEVLSSLNLDPFPLRPKNRRTYD